MHLEADTQDTAAKTVLDAAFGVAAGCMVQAVPFHAWANVTWAPMLSWV